MKGSIDIESTQAFFMGISILQGVFKTLIFFKSKEKIRNLMNEIDVLCEKITVKHQDKFAVEFNFNSLIVNFMFLNVFAYISIYYVAVPLLLNFKSYIQGEEIEKNFFIKHWFPFDESNFYTSVFIYNLVIVYLTHNSIVALEGYVNLTFCQLSVLFRGLAEDIVEIVNEYDEKELNVTKKRLTLKLRTHVKLIEVTKNLAEMFEIAWLIHTICYAVSSCFMLLKALLVDKTLNELLVSLATGGIMFNYFLYFCYIGETVFTGVSNYVHIV